VQETGWKRLNADGVTLIAADAPDQFVDETPTLMVYWRLPIVAGAV
jgi:hypothetical protein